MAGHLEQVKEGAIRRPSLGTHHLRLPSARDLAERAIVLHDGRPRTVGKSQVHQNLYPTSTERLDKRHTQQPVGLSQSRLRNDTTFGARAFVIKRDVAVCARRFDIELTAVREFTIRFAYGIVRRFFVNADRLLARASWTRSRTSPLPAG